MTSDEELHILRVLIESLRSEIDDLHSNRAELIAQIDERDEEIAQLYRLLHARNEEIADLYMQMAEE